MNPRARTFSLRARLTVLLALAVLVVLGAAARLVDLRADSDMRARFDVSVLARAQALVAAIDAGGSAESRDRAAGVFPGTTGRSWYELRCSDGVIARTPEVPPPGPMSDEPTFSNAHLDQRSLRVVAWRFTGADLRPGAPTSATAACFLRYGVDRDPLNAILHALDFILLATILSACVVVLLATPWLVGRGLRPLAGLVQAMADIGPDTPGARLPPNDTAELAPLVTRFNEVLARMDDGLAREQRFASGVAHEFRTRLAELHTLIDVEMRYPSGRDPRATLAEIGKIGTELEATVAALLQLTRIQSGIESPRPEALPLYPWLVRTCARHRAAAAGRVQVECEIRCTADQQLTTDPALLGIVVDNLLGNAVAYAPADSAVQVSADAEGICIRNAAPALEQGDVANLGRRFWRKGRQDSTHAGLGLALAGAAARTLGMPLAFELADGVLHARLRWRG